MINGLMIRVSREVTAVADSSKFHRRSLSLIADVSDVQRIVTDDGADPKLVAAAARAQHRGHGGVKTPARGQRRSWDSVIRARPCSRSHVECSVASAPWSPVKAADRLPEIAAPVLFDTPEADRILSTLQILPPDNPWHEDITNRPVHEMSAAIVKSIGADAPLGYNLDMNFVIVPANQAMVNVRITDYPDESDPGPFPIPSNAPIENWPLARNEDTKALPRPGITLEQFQREGSGDRHLILVDPAHGRFHEFWQARLTDTGWQASQATTFDLAHEPAASGALDVV